MKKILPLAFLLTAFFFLSNTVSAQLNFFNGTPCGIKVKASSTTNPNACIGPYCATTTYYIAPGQFFAIPVGPNCLISPTPPNFRATKFYMQGGATGSVDLCTNPVQLLTDCQGNPRTFQIFPGNFAAIY